MTETTPGHFPDQVGIDAYGNSGFRFAEMSHRGSLLCLPTGMLGWSVATPADITLDSLAPVLAAADDIPDCRPMFGRHCASRVSSSRPLQPAAPYAPIMSCWPSIVPWRPR